MCDTSIVNNKVMIAIMMLVMIIPVVNKGNGNNGSLI